MIGAPPQEAPQPRLALSERQRAQVLAIQPQQIESDETCGRAPTEQVHEDRSAAFVRADQFAIENRISDSQPLRQRHGQSVHILEAVAVA